MESLGAGVEAGRRNIFTAIKMLLVLVVSFGFDIGDEFMGSGITGFTLAREKK